MPLVPLRVAAARALAAQHGRHMPPTTQKTTSGKRPRPPPEADDDRVDPAKVLSAALEVRCCPGGGRGNGVFARVALAAGWMWKDHPVCVPNVPRKGDAERRLPHIDDVDELMEELASRERYGELLHGPWAMSHIVRHLDMQDTTEAELPDWATRRQMPLAEYNLLAAQLQTQVAREDGGDGLVLLPQIRLANHACDANTELAYAPELEPGCCACGLGHFVLRTVRTVAVGEELTWSYIGSSALMTAAERNERRALLQRRWDFMCECALCRLQEPASECAA